jgi:hypothetical protein
MYIKIWPGNFNGRDCMGHVGKNGWVISKLMLKILGVNVGAGLNRHSMR